MPSHTASERKKKHKSSHGSSHGSSHRRPRIRRSQRQKISDKIALLRREGKTAKQAAGQAHGMARSGDL